MLLSSLQSAASAVKEYVFSYDIACQFSRHFSERWKKLFALPFFPERLKLKLSEVYLDWVVPKFHIMAHGPSCQTDFSLNYKQHMARTDGENIERGWAAFNPASMQVREMGSGSRRDVLNYHFDAWNFQRIVNMGMTTFSSHVIADPLSGTVLGNRLKEAKRELIRQSKSHENFSEGFPTEVLDQIVLKIDQWNIDPDNSQDPYADGRLSELK